MKKLIIIAFMASAAVCVGQSSGGNRNTIVAGTYLQPGTALVQASTFGVKADTQYIQDVTLTNGSATVDCTFTNKCNFTSADIGKICYAQANSPSNGTPILPQGTISAIVDSQHATCSGGNATANQVHNATFVWGSDDTTALQTAWNNSGFLCLSLKLPAGTMLTTKAQFITQSATCNANRVAAQDISGYGQSATLIVPTPSFDFTTCVVPSVTHSVLGTCFFGLTFEVVHDLQLTGFFVGSTALTKALVGNEYIMWNVVFGNWCSQGCANTNGFNSTNQQANSMEGGAENLGALSCVVNANQVFFGPNWACIGTNSFGLDVNTGTLKSIGGFFSGSTNSVFVTAGTQWQSDFDEIGGGGLGPIAINGTAYINRFNALNLTNAGSFPWTIGAAGKLYITNSNMNPVSGVWTTCTAGGKVWDQGANTTTGPPNTNCVTPELQSITEVTPTISAGFGTSPSVVSNGGTHSFTINVGTGGAASTGTIGFPSAAPHGWTCSCTDTTTNSATVFACKQTAAGNTTTAPIGEFTAAGAAQAWTASDILAVSCTPY